MRRAILAAVVLGFFWLEAEAERAILCAGAKIRGMPPVLRPSVQLVHLACVSWLPMALLGDEALSRRVRAGDLSALETLYRTYEAAIFSLARRLCGSDAEADDVLQDTFVEVGRSLNRYRGEGPLLAWLKRICVSKALMRMRGSERFLEEAQASERQAEPFRGRRDLESALARISPTTRAVLWLHDVEGYTHEEIATLLKKSVSFSKSQLSRGHARLRELLSKEEEEL